MFMTSPGVAVDLLIRKTGGTWEPPATRGYVNEAELQEILHAQPSLIQGISSDAIAVREFSTGVGPADLVIVDASGSITVVECKLATNQDIRRTIMGQVLDYAARLSEMSSATFLEQWARQGGKALDAFFASAAEGTRRDFVANLEAGVFTLVLAVDVINADLRRIVRYLNSHTSAGMRVLAIELRRAVHGDTEILIPTVYGTESADEKNARTGNASKWTHESVDDWLRKRDAALADAVQAVSTGLAAAGYRLHGGGTGTYPSFSYGGTASGLGDVFPFSVYCGERPSLGLNFQWVERAGRDAQARFVGDLRAADIAFDDAAVIAADYRRRISVPLELLLDATRQAAVVTAAARLTRGSSSTEPPEQ